MRPLLAAALLSAAALSVSCGGVVDPSKNVVDTFNGTIPVQGTSPGHPFSTNKTGEYSVKVTALAPSSNNFFGSILAQGLSDGTCSGQLPILQQNSFGTMNTPVLSGPIIAGRYCVFLFDIGTFTVPQTYTLTVSHP